MFTAAPTHIMWTKAGFGRNIQNKRIISRRNRRKLRRLTARHLTDLRHGRPPESLQARINLASALCGSNYYEWNHAEVFDNGTDKFNALLADIAAAQHYINLQYYIIVDDNIGTRVLSALEERARAGVKVRIIYDHVGSFKLSRKALRSTSDSQHAADMWIKNCDASSMFIRSIWKPASAVSASAGHSDATASNNR